MKRLLVICLVGMWWVLLLAGCAAREPQMAMEESLDYDAAPAPEALTKEMEGNVREVAMSGEATHSLGDVTERMIIRNGRLELVVMDTLAAEESIGELADELEGYLLSTESNRYAGGLLRISLTLRVPATTFNTAMARLRDLATEVTYESISSDDVTQEYVDLESRLRALKIKAQKLEELMDEAEDTEAVLAIYQELSATEQEIEHVKGRMQYLERSAAMATITVTLTPDALAQPVEIAGWHPQGTAKRALQALINAYQFLFDTLIWLLIFVVPVLAAIGLSVALFVKLIKYIFFRNRKKKGKAIASPPASPAKK
ncbi:MAG TPA: DUF4349 domain-containing protein [Thermoflexia bacterium]|nr:DUF4349 domain-containing protein [Thermoflexia bacterium]